MDHDELHQAVIRTEGTRSALAALVLAGDHDGARRLAAQLSREDLETMAILAAHAHAFSRAGAIEGVMVKQGTDPEQARGEAIRASLSQFRASAAAFPDGRDGDGAAGGQRP